MKPAFRAAAIAALVLAAWPGAAMAHDFFLLPEQFHGAGSFAAHATVGAAFPTPETFVGQDRIGALRASDGASLAVAGASTQSLRLMLTAERPGAHVAGVRLLPRDVEYEGERIALIMDEYQVSAEAAQAVAALAAPRVLRATSERFAKAIVCSETCAGRGGGRSIRLSAGIRRRRIRRKPVPPAVERTAVGELCRRHRNERRARKHGDRR